MEKLFILMLVVAVVAGEKKLDAKLAADYTDADNNGVIDDAEFAVGAIHSYSLRSKFMDISTKHDSFDFGTTHSGEVPVAHIPRGKQYSNSKSSVKRNQPVRSEPSIGFGGMAAYAAQVTTHIEPKMRVRFTPPTGDIQMGDFISVVETLVEKAMEAGAPKPHYSADQTGAYFDKNHDGTIQPHEFDDWYALSMKYNMEFLKKAMQQGDDIITKAEFLGVLSYMETLKFFE